MITLNVLRCLSPWVDYLAPKPQTFDGAGPKSGEALKLRIVFVWAQVSLMGSLELFHLYHHFVARRLFACADSAL